MLEFCGNCYPSNPHWFAWSWDVWCPCHGLFSPCDAACPIAGDNWWTPLHAHQHESWFCCCFVPRADLADSCFVGKGYEWQLDQGARWSASGSEQIRTASKQPWKQLKVVANNVRFKFVLPSEPQATVDANHGTRWANAKNSTDLALQCRNQLNLTLPSSKSLRVRFGLRVRSCPKFRWTRLAQSVWGLFCVLLMMLSCTSGPLSLSRLNHLASWSSIAQMSHVKRSCHIVRSLSPAAARWTMSQCLPMQPWCSLAREWLRSLLVTPWFRSSLLKLLRSSSLCTRMSIPRIGKIFANPNQEPHQDIPSLAPRVVEGCPEPSSRLGGSVKIAACIPCAAGHHVVSRCPAHCNHQHEPWWDFDFQVQAWHWQQASCDSPSCISLHVGFVRHKHACSQDGCWSLDEVRSMVRIQAFNASFCSGCHRWNEANGGEDSVHCSVQAFGQHGARRPARPHPYVGRQVPCAQAEATSGVYLPADPTVGEHAVSAQ